MTGAGVLRSQDMMTTFYMRNSNEASLRCEVCSVEKPSLNRMFFTFVFPTGFQGIATPQI